MQAAIAMEKPTRKRGRPPITKEYPNPLQSPMAHSSMQVQKQGLTGQNFSKPLMKVGQMTPSPKKRRSGSTTGSSVNHIASGGCSRKGRYRGVILSTPPKKSISTPSSININNSILSKSEMSPLPTPSSINDTIFSSNSKLNFLRSSPPMPSSPFNSIKHGLQLEKPIAKSTVSPLQNFRFSLNINENGRATIARPGETIQIEGIPNISSDELNSSTLNFPLESPSLNCKSENDKLIKNNDNVQLEKNYVISMLRQMRTDINKGKSNNLENTLEEERKVVNELESKLEDSIANDKNNKKLPIIVKTSPTHDEDLKDDDRNAKFNTDSLKHHPNTNSLLPPSTPKTTFHLTTGFTPIAIDQILLDETIIATPRRILGASFDSNNENNFALSPKSKLLPKSGQTILSHSHQQEFVFKLSSGDPLLLTDHAEVSWNDNINTASLTTSPRRQLCFNTPPSWVNFGSPKAFSPQRLDTNAVLISNGQSLGVTQPELSPSKKSSIANFPMININSSPPRIASASSLSHIELLSSTVKRRRSSLSVLSTLAASNLNLLSSPGNNISAKALIEPTTPKNAQEFQSSVIECTPLIQQTMNGSLTAKFIPGTIPADNNNNDIRSNINSDVVNNNSINNNNNGNNSNHRNSNSNNNNQPTVGTINESSTVSSSLEQDDARTALKRLMSER
ncbi:hypothetical protein Kpol_489p15 [Vanderwaltozyma polyspora DSM 70294]|uniref:Uncharacterized protein n=1 Tax=Vanderwaltozyma polyspora (strain ATCC 22028 / DSM 70294 / BCRC 21397 / CBS 2163 / NBRC 10782 / NRRL Y-8283 / UCD 57-17) TaxID=436907 RepID=A7TQ29_VANPO|nr:uncharacterized protein Kpol_489p15 [Vanderwaltozyma polyspora DSM 70294]EDO15634.1 hypothetical protein Kpol_489p15 [Vanderwaltozyma polyspora DSM 70294]